MDTYYIVTPAQAGVHKASHRVRIAYWIPAFAGMTI
jgi:hypothetical protein